MSRWLVPALICCSLYGFSQGRITPSRIHDFEKYADQVRKEWDVPGMSVAIVKDHQVIFKKGYGVRELGKPGAVDTQTLFACASTTKAMTVALMGMLVDEGKIRWNDPVQKFLPELQLYDPYVTRELTVRDLLIHDSGIGGTDFFTGAMNIPVSEMIRRMAFVRPSYPFRKGFVYQNIMYSFAGRIIERITGRKWSEVIRERLFIPLGMHATAPKRSFIETKNLVRPHFRIGDTIRVIDYGADSEIGSAGAVWSNAEDISKWMICMLDSSKFEGGRLLKPETWTEIFRPQTFFPEDEYPTMEILQPNWRTYGLGWYQHDYKGQKVNFHTGSLSGLTAITAQLPAANFGIFIFGNLDHAEVRHALVYKSFDWFVLGGDTDWNAAFKKLYGDLSDEAKKRAIAFEARREEDTSPTLPLAKYAGKYQSPLYGEAEVTLDGEALFFNINNVVKASLPHWENDTFYGQQEKAWYGKALARFVMTQTGEVKELVFNGMVFARP